MLVVLIGTEFSIHASLGQVGTGFTTHVAIGVSSSGRWVNKGASLQGWAKFKWNVDCGCRAWSCSFSVTLCPGAHLQLPSLDLVGTSGFLVSILSILYPQPDALQWGFTPQICVFSGQPKLYGCAAGFVSCIKDTNASLTPWLTEVWVLIPALPPNTCVNLPSPCLHVICMKWRKLPCQGHQQMRRFKKAVVLSRKEKFR